MSSIRKPTALSFVFISAAMLLFCSLPALAQDEDSPRPKAEIRLTGGVSGFTGDDGEIPHGVAGGSFRVYVTRRVSIEPEFLYMTNNPNDRDYLGPGECGLRFWRLGQAIRAVCRRRRRCLAPSQSILWRGLRTGQPRVFDTSYTSLAVSAGGGVKMFLTKRLFIAPEARVGYQPSLRATVSIGYVF